MLCSSNIGWCLHLWRALGAHGSSAQHWHLGSRARGRLSALAQPGYIIRHCDTSLRRTVAGFHAQSSMTLLGFNIAAASVVFCGLQQILCRSLQQKHGCTADELLSAVAPAQVGALLHARAGWAGTRACRGLMPSDRCCWAY